MKVLLGAVGKWRNKAKEIMETSSMVVKFYCLYHVTTTYISEPCLVSGPSMLPTFNLAGDVLLIDAVSTRLGKVALGDIVALQSPENPKQKVVKRILGMEGDTVTFVADPIRNPRTHTLLVPKGHVWIQGDNVYQSHDSRYYGPVPYGLIQGKVFCRVWPLKDAGLL